MQQQLAVIEDALTVLRNLEPDATGPGTATSRALDMFGGEDEAAWFAREAWNQVRSRA
jgi:hypothetical protein